MSYGAAVTGQTLESLNIEKKNIRKQFEVDFIANRGNVRYYIQSAFAMNDNAKKEQEISSLKNIKDAFKRVIIVKDNIMPYYDDNGFLIIGLFDFLLSSESLESQNYTKSLFLQNISIGRDSKDVPWNYIPKNSPIKYSHK